MSFSRSAADPADTLPTSPPRSAARHWRVRHARRRVSYAAAGRAAAAPYVVGFSDEVAQLLDLPPSIAAQPGFAELFAGNPTRDWPAMPYAAVYSGHQFGVWAGQLGDGRALTIGERTGTDGRRYELQLKGSGRTPYSRMGDGRAVLRSSIREFLCSEAMHHLGIPTTRALTVIGSDQPVVREEIETSAVVTRVSESFVRFGHFEHFFSNDRPDLLRQLADHVIDRFYPDCRHVDDPYLALLEAATLRTADLVAQWQAVGFCHGVMNTDNMSILGVTIDYGPFGFVDAFDANHICNHSDTSGRYAYRMQPRIAHWNCYCLAQAAAADRPAARHRRRRCARRACGGGRAGRARDVPGPFRPRARTCDAREARPWRSNARTMPKPPTCCSRRCMRATRISR